MKVDIAIITVRKDEFLAVRSRFTTKRQPIPDGRTYLIGEVRTENQTYSIAIARSNDQGTDAAQRLAHYIIYNLDPRLILVVGIAGGVPRDNFTLGDVVISTRIVNPNVDAWLANGITDFSIRGGPPHPMVEDITSLLPGEPQLATWADHIHLERPTMYPEQEKIIGDPEWCEEVLKSLAWHFGEGRNVSRAPKFTIGPILSSNHLMKDPARLKEILKTNRAILAVETEAAGVYEAAQGMVRQYPVIAIRGISDIVGLQRDSRWTEYACQAAAAFTYAFIMTDPLDSPQHSVNSQNPAVTSEISALLRDSEPSSDRQHSIRHQEDTQENTKYEFFVSYAEEDKMWGEWLVWQLEDAGHSVGSSFSVGKMLPLEEDKILQDAKHIVIVLSPAAWRNGRIQAHWAFAHNQDPTGKEGKFIPVYIKKEVKELKGLPFLTMPIELYGIAEETALQRLQSLLLQSSASRQNERRKRPPFPGAYQGAIAQGVIASPPSVQNSNLVSDAGSRLSSSEDTLSFQSPADASIDLGNFEALERDPGPSIDFDSSGSPPSASYSLSVDLMFEPPRPPADASIDLDGFNPSLSPPTLEAGKEQTQQAAPSKDDIRVSGKARDFVTDNHDDEVVVNFGEPPDHHVNPKNIGEVRKPPLRYLHARLPERAKIVDRIPLQVRVALLPAPSRSTSLRAFFIPDEGTDLKLVLDCPGLLLHSASIATVHVVPTADSDWVLFELEAILDGVYTLEISAFIEGAFLGTLSLQITVDSSALNAHSIDHFTLLPIRSPRDGEITLVIHYDPLNAVYRYQLRGATFGETDELYSGPLRRKQEEAIADFTTLFNKQARDLTGYSAEETRRWLQGKGIELWKELIPKELEKLFWQQRENIKWMTILSAGDPMPWEVMYPTSDAGDDAGFLAEQFPIARWIFGSAPPTRLQCSQPFFVVPDDAPLTAEDELAVLRHIMEKGEKVNELTPLLRLLDTAEFDTLHFACHNIFYTDSPTSSSIQLGPKRFVPTFLSKYTGHFHQHSPLIFMNACRSDGMAANYTWIAGWAKSFLTAGAGAFIGSLWEVRDSSASLFAENFYRALYSGIPLGDAMKQARTAIQNEPSDPTWLAYTLYGSPAAVLSKVTSKSIEK